MTYENYGIQFRRLTSDFAELVRFWRNHYSINQYMEIRDHISEEDQKKWFEKTLHPSYLNLLILINGDPAGLLNGKEIDFENGTLESGIFFWAKQYHKTDIPVRTVYAAGEMTFDFCGMKEIYAKILSDNEQAIVFNKFIGYEMMPGQEAVRNQKYFLTAERYAEKNESILKMLRKNYPDKPKVHFEKADFEHGFADAYLTAFEKNHANIEVSY